MKKILIIIVLTLTMISCECRQRQLCNVVIKNDRNEVLHDLKNVYVTSNSNSLYIFKYPDGRELRFNIGENSNVSISIRPIK